MMRAVVLALVSCLGSSLVVGVARFATREAAPVLPTVRVAVLERDCREGTPLAAGDLGEALVPGELVAKAWLSPEQATAYVGKPCLSMEKGLPITAAHFAETTWSDRATECGAAIAEEVNAAADAAAEKVVGNFERRLEPAHEAPKGRVLFVTRELKAGDVLKAGDLREGDAPREFVTSSWIPAERREELVGQRLITELEEGAPLWWQMLNTPGTARSCEFEASHAFDEAEKLTAQRAAAAWVERESASW